MGRRGDAEGNVEGIVGPESVSVERVSRVSTWTAEVRLRFMVMAAVAPLLTSGLVVYWLCVFWVRLPTYVVLGASLIVAVSCSSNVSVVVGCVWPRLARSFWVLRGMQVGVGVWAPVAMLLFFATGMVSVFSSMFLATGIFLFCKIVVPADFRDGRFTVRQIMWLTTWVAAVATIFAAISRALGEDWMTFNSAGAALAAGTPGVTMMTLMTMLADVVEDIEADRKNASEVFSAEAGRRGDAEGGAGGES